MPDPISEVMSVTNTAATSRVDLHCHSTASAVAGLGVQRSLGLPECATAPEEVYELAKRRGMDFVTITDHDTIAGALEIADRPDTFLAVELTTRFAGEPRAAAHVLCHGITSDDHDWLQAHAGDVARCAEYLHANSIACALAHPFYMVDEPLTAQHRRSLASLFPIWEVRNGARPEELNRPAAIYVETRGGTGIGGSDDHAGVAIGRTFTETPSASTPEEFLGFVREGHARARGDQGSAIKWAHSAIALAIRALGHCADPAPPSPKATLEIVERIVDKGSARAVESAGDLGPEHARALLAAWLDSVGLDGSTEDLVRRMQEPEFEHAGLLRHARQVHERELRASVGRTTARINSTGDVEASLPDIFRACMPVIPYVSAMAFLGREWESLGDREEGPHKVALVADGLGDMHGVTHTLEELRHRGVRGFEVEVVGTDAGVDRRLAAVAEIELPLYPGLRLGVPSLLAAFETIAQGGYDLVHVCSPGPAGLVAALVARASGLPLAGSYHTELGAYAELRSGAPYLRTVADQGQATLYGACRVVLSPSEAADESLAALGIAPERVMRWDRGVDTARFSPALRDPELFPGEINVLYAGRLSSEKGIDLLAAAFLQAKAQDRRLHMVIAGGGPEQALLRARLGEHATFLGWLEGEELARAYASADLFLFPSRTDTFGQVVLEAQASGLPVVAVAEGGPRSLVEDGISGLLCPPQPDALAERVLRLAASEQVRSRLAAGAVVAAHKRSWEGALARLADGYGAALGAPANTTRIAA